MARELGIRVDAIRLPPDLTPRHASRFAALGELYDLNSPNDREKRVAIHRYIRFLLAGPAAVMIQIERRQGYDAFWPHHARFRRMWRERRLLRNDADADFAYFLAMAWTSAREKSELQEKFLRFWDQAVEAFEYPSLWRRVDRVAQRLITHGQISVGTALGPS